MLGMQAPRRGNSHQLDAAGLLDGWQQRRVREVAGTQHAEPHVTTFVALRDRKFDLLRRCTTARVIGEQHTQERFAPLLAVIKS